MAESICGKGRKIRLEEELRGLDHKVGPTAEKMVTLASECPTLDSQLQHSIRKKSLTLHLVSSPQMSESWEGAVLRSRVSLSVGRSQERDTSI